jgi:hypothetical protein
MRRLPGVLAALGAAALVLGVMPVASGDGDAPWSASAPFTKVVASSPTTGGG